MQRLRPTLWLIIIFGALTAVFLFKLAFTDLILGRGDTFNYFYPYWDIRNEAFRQGTLPLWSPDIFMGVPLLANPQVGTFYPPNWLTIPFQAPNAIRISILLHVAWAGMGMAVLARKVVKLDWIPAIITGILFAFGGVITGHIEQINQLQGLAWLPWVLWFAHRLVMHCTWRNVFLLSIGLALQVFTGHTQTVFITLVGIGVYVILNNGFVSSNTRLRQIGYALFWVALAGMLALLLAAPQLIPSLELTNLSNRSGGFTAQQATAFSLPPTSFGRGLLPSYDGQLFGEYTFTIGVTGLGLALLGVTIPRHHTHHRQRLIWGVIALLGLALSFGRFNPLYLLLAELPGFNFFRVPARWIVLFEIGLALLAGIGVQVIINGYRPNRRLLTSIGVALLGLMLLTYFVLPIDPEDVLGNATPTSLTLLLWIIALLAFVVLLWLPKRRGIFALAIVLVELWLASLVLPHNDLIPADAYLGQRFTISQMQVYQDRHTPLPRTLGISELFFDTGDTNTLIDRYQRLGLDEVAIRHALVATKKQEVLFPNLALRWHIPSVDGFGGGVLPTENYSLFTSLFLPPTTEPTQDGRLGEILSQPTCRGACIPALPYLDATNTGYIITDKVYDVWYEGIAYDTNLPINIASDGGSYHTSEFQFTAVDVLFRGEPPQILGVDWQAHLLVAPHDLEHLRFQALEPTTTETIQLASSDTTIFAVTLLDERTGNFLQLAPNPWERGLSSDIKIYARDSLDRAYLTNQVVSVSDATTALTMMQQPDYHPRDMTIVHSDVPPIEGAAQNYDLRIEQYEPTFVEIAVDAEAESMLVLSDAYYPGWQAMIDGELTDIYRANIMFRGVIVPAGEHRVVFRFEPQLWQVAGVVGLVAWLVVFILWFIFERTHRSE